MVKSKKNKKESEYNEPTLFPSFQYEEEEEGGGSVVSEELVDLTFRNYNTQYLTHGFHSYPAKFIPQLPTWLMLQYSKEGDTILDPFAGSGTTLVEALLNNRNCVGTEINPIGRLTSKAKSTIINTLDLQINRDELYRNIGSLMNKFAAGHGIFQEAGRQINNDLWIPANDVCTPWFLPEVVNELSVILHSIKKCKDNNFKTLALVAFSSIIKSVSNARTEERNPKLRKELRTKPDTIRIFKNKLDKMSRDLIQFAQAVKGNFVSAKIIGDDARKLPLADNTIDMVVTSPPYAYAMDYVRMHKLSLYWLGIENPVELDKNFVGTERVYSKCYKGEFNFNIPYVDDVIQKLSIQSRKKAYIVYKYFMDMQKCFEEMYRVMKVGSTAAIVIGNSTVQSVEIHTHLCFNEIARVIGFQVQPALERVVPLESKGLSNVHKDFGGEMVKKEYINIFNRPTKIFLN